MFSAVQETWCADCSSLWPVGTFIHLCWPFSHESLIYSVTFFSTSMMPLVTLPCLMLPFSSLFCLHNCELCIAFLPQGTSDFKFTQADILDPFKVVWVQVSFSNLWFGVHLNNTTASVFVAIWMLPAQIIIHRVIVKLRKAMFSIVCMFLLNEILGVQEALVYQDHRGNITFIFLTPVMFTVRLRSINLIETSH